MSTQHPDNVQLPFFAENAVLAGEDEIQEAYYAFSHLGCDEQMWDCEGKDVDSYVITKLLSKYESYFLENKIGKDVRITLRVPNPEVEKAEAKVLLETLESIPRSYDVAKVFYGKDVVAPVFEVIVPMVTNAASLDHVYRYYTDVVVGKQKQTLGKDGITIAEWIGEFRPETVNIIPLFEDRESILNAHNIVREYLRDKKVDSLRVFIARSDPALNYGNVSNVLLYKIAAKRLHALSRELKIPIYIILGAGSAPFRGNLRPQTVERVMVEYPSTQTFTIQSSFKYDSDHDVVRHAIEKLRAHTATAPQVVDEAACEAIIEKYATRYQEQIRELALIINRVAKYVPSRRKRKLHIGLFGYSRKMGDVSLPRAITFTAALYSIGVPPELLGLDVLTDEDIIFLKTVYVNFEADLRDALRFSNFKSTYMPKSISGRAKELVANIDYSREHNTVTHQINAALESGNTAAMGEYVLRAARVRGFLG